MVFWGSLTLSKNPFVRNQQLKYFDHLEVIFDTFCFNLILITLSKFIFIILMSKHQGPKVLGEERMD